MDPKELRGLVEAYTQVYELDENRMASRMEKMPSAPAKVGKATHSIKDLVPSKEPTPEQKAKARKALGLGEATAMAKRGLDEPTIRQNIAKSTGGGASADRATALSDKPTYGNSAKQNARDNLARKQRGDFRKTNSSNPGLQGYAHKSNDPDVKAKQAARGAQRGSATLTPNEKKKLNMGEAVDLFDTVLEFLYVEGYAETLEEAEWLMANVIDEEAIDIILDEGKLPLDKERRTKIGNQIGKRLQSSGSEIIGSGSAFMPKGIRNNLRQSAAKKVGEVKKMMGVLKSAQKEDYMDEEQSPIPRGTPMNKRWPYISNKDPEFQTALDRVNKKKSKKTGISEDYMDEGAAGDVAARAEKLAAQRKGQTPERKQMYASLSSKASERERGGPRIIDLGGRGGRKGLTQSQRDARREDDAEYSYETGDKNSTLGPGTITKNKRKLAQQKARGQHAESFDLYDIILSHLLDEGYADTQKAAEAIMVNMSEDWRESIVETRMDPRGRPASGPMNVYGKSKPNTDPAFQAALKSVREKEAKKTPEQRKAELDDYKARQMNR